LRFITVLAMGQFAFPLAVAYLPLNLYLTRFYAGDLRLDIATVGAVIVIARLFDFIVDPIVGALADRYGHTWGRRRTWTLIAVPVLMVGVAAGLDEAVAGLLVAKVGDEGVHLVAGGGGDLVPRCAEARFIAAVECYGDTFARQGVGAGITETLRRRADERLAPLETEIHQATFPVEVRGFV
jgi:MFS family permease